MKEVLVREHPCGIGIWELTSGRDVHVKNRVVVIKRSIVNCGGVDESGVQSTYSKRCRWDADICDKGTIPLIPLEECSAGSC